MVSDRAFKFNIYIPLSKTLSLVPKSRSSVKVKVKYQGHSFRKKKKKQKQKQKKKKMTVAGAFVFHKHILLLRVFMRSNQIVYTYQLTYFYFLVVRSIYVPECIWFRLDTTCTINDIG